MVMYTVLLIWLAFGVISYVLAPQRGRERRRQFGTSVLGPIVFVLGLIIALAVSITHRRNLSPAS